MPALGELDDRFPPTKENSNVRNDCRGRLRPELTELPLRMRGLPLDERGYPVPWFVAWIDGKPEFRCRYGEMAPSGAAKTLLGVRPAARGESGLRHRPDVRAQPHHRRAASTSPMCGVVAEKLPVSLAASNAPAGE
jgi:hypothetical protein